MAGIDHFRLDNRLIYRVKVNDSTFATCLIDTGASTSICSSKLASNLGKLNNKNIMKVSGYDGHVSETLGTILINLTLLRTNSSISIKALVVKECNPSIILGVQDVKRLGFKMIDPKGTECLAYNTLPPEYEPDENLHDMLLNDNKNNLETIQQNQISDSDSSEDQNSLIELNNCCICSNCCPKGTNFANDEANSKEKLNQLQEKTQADNTLCSDKNDNKQLIESPIATNCNYCNAIEESILNDSNKILKEKVNKVIQVNFFSFCKNCDKTNNEQLIATAIKSICTCNLLSDEINKSLKNDIKVKSNNNLNDLLSNDSIEQKSHNDNYNCNCNSNAEVAITDTNITKNELKVSKQNQPKRLNSENCIQNGNNAQCNHVTCNSNAALLTDELEKDNCKNIAKCKENQSKTLSNCNYPNNNHSNELNEMSNYSICSNCEQSNYTNLNSSLTNEENETEYKDICFSKQIIHIEDEIYGIPYPLILSS